MVLTPELRRFRIAALLEGTSLLILLISMVARIRYNGPDLASTLGPLHGIAFTGYVITALHARPDQHWTRSRTAFILLAALVPLGGHAVARRAHAGGDR